MEIKSVEIDETATVLAIYRSCVCQHQKEGFNQWDSTYPNLETITLDIQNNWLFGGYINNKLVAVISITEDEPVDYASVEWTDKKGKYYIIHRLCIVEQYLRKGIAKALMLFAEQYTINNHRSSIRLDTYSLNKGALAFYQALNYQKVGFVKFPKREEGDYTCFEKIVSKIM